MHKQKKESRSKGMYKQNINIETDQKAMGRLEAMEFLS